MTELANAKVSHVGLIDVAARPEVDANKAQADFQNLQ